LILLSIDPGVKNTGVVVTDTRRPGSPLLLHTLTPGGTPYYTLRSSLVRLIVRYRPACLIAEGAFQASRFANAHIEAIGIIKGLSEEYGIELASYAPTGWKKIAFGQGRMNKEEVLQKVKSMGYAPATTHEADAVGLVLAFMKGNELCREADHGVSYPPL